MSFWLKWLRQKVDIMLLLYFISLLGHVTRYSKVLKEKIGAS